MNCLRLSAPATPPSSSWSDVRSQPFSCFTVPGGGSPIVQPPRSVSNDVAATDAPSSLTSVSSTQRPRPWTAGSVATVIDTSTCLPAYADRSIRQSVQPPELPVAAFHVPVVPVGEQVSPPPVTVW